MMLLVSGTTRSVRDNAEHAGGRLGILLTPDSGNSVATTVSTGLKWACDNAAFSGFNPARFRRLLRLVAGQRGLLWIACPDFVGSAKATAVLYDEWREEVAHAGPVAFVLQDGQENLTLPNAACYFIGGTTRFKLSNAAADLVAEGKRRGAWIHCGRVNSFRRLEVAYDMGCDSVDGSSMAKFGDTHIPRFLRCLKRLERQPVLF